MTKVYIKIKHQVFECLAGQTELSYEQGRCELRVSKFTAVIITPQPWSCKTQRMWEKLPKKRRTVRIVMVTESSATEWVFKDVDITFISDLEQESNAPRHCRPLLPVLKGETLSEPETVVHNHAWWQV